MAIHDTPAYLLSYRSQNTEEDKRLDSQHDVIKQAILGGHLIHPSIPLAEVGDSIADVGCGTGIWLADVMRTYLVNPPPTKSPNLVGFDANAHAFDSTIPHPIKLVQHDCTEDFAAEYIGKFGLVNIRGLAYAVPDGHFSRLISNAIGLLRPGGYLQWLETEAQLFQLLPTNEKFVEAIEKIESERQQRGLVQDIPKFMLRELIKQDDRKSLPLSILHFNMLPGGISRDSSVRENTLNRRFSDTVLESIKLLLGASLGKSASESQVSDVSTDKPGRNVKNSGQSVKIGEEEIRVLMGAIDDMRSSDGVLAGGVFPHLVARKSNS